MEYQKSFRKLNKQLWFKLTEDDFIQLHQIALRKERSVAYILRKLVEEFVKTNGESSA